MPSLGKGYVSAVMRRAPNFQTLAIQAPKDSIQEAMTHI
jgi:hypothetical protein